MEIKTIKGRNEGSGKKSLGMKQLHAFVYGFVQGVGFRQFVKKESRKLGLVGWVKNLPDGRVELVAQGPQEQLDVLVKLLHKGSFISDVEGVEVEWETVKETFSTFDVVR